MVPSNLTELHFSKFLLVVFGLKSVWSHEPKAALFDDFIYPRVFFHLFLDPSAGIILLFFNYFGILFYFHFGIFCANNIIVLCLGRGIDSHSIDYTCNL